MKMILGSGITGLLARKILGPDWILIPFKRSRFFSFKPALDDNFVIRDQRLDDFMLSLGARPLHLYKIVVSCGGQLFTPTKELIEPWLDRVYGEDRPGHLGPILSKRSVFGVYDIKLNELYQSLCSEYQEDIMRGKALGMIQQIKQGSILIGGRELEMNQCVSTIPLPATQQLLGRELSYESKPIWMYHIATDCLDFEGANQVLTTDGTLFYKCSNIAPQRYLFYCDAEIPIPGTYFMQFMSRLDVLDGTVIPDSMIRGPKPELDLTAWNITCVGAYAEWDAAMDVGTSLMRLLSLPK